jgi:hypothetical protein
MYQHLLLLKELQLYQFKESALIQNEQPKQSYYALRYFASLYSYMHGKKRQ